MRLLLVWMIPIEVNPSSLLAIEEMCVGRSLVPNPSTSLELYRELHKFHTVPSFGCIFHQLLNPSDQVPQNRSDHERLPVYPFRTPISSHFRASKASNLLGP